MNTDSDETRHQAHPQHPGWRESIAALVSSRIGIIQIELRQALRDRSRSFAALIAAAACIFFTWALLLVGGIAALSAATGWPWHIIALIASAAHLLAAIALFKSARAPKSPAFPVTRAEFQKDREWIDHLQKKPASRS